MKRNEDDNLTLQTNQCSSYDITSICSCDRELITSPTKPILHQQSRFLVIHQGKAKINIQGLSYELAQGCIVCVMPYQYSKIVDVKEELLYDLIIYNFQLFNSIIKGQLNFYNESINLVNLFTHSHVVRCDEKVFKDVTRICNNLREELGAESLNFEKKTKNKFSSIYVASQILEIISIFSRQKNEKIEKQDSEENMDQIFQYIYLNLGQNMTLEDLSKIFYMSQTSLSNYIYKRTGYSYSEIIFQMKISRIENFLLYTDMTLEEISSILGYSDSSYISKFFQSQKKFNIGDYKKTYKKISAISKMKENKISYQIVDYIYKYYYLDLTNLDLAKHFNISVFDVNFHLKYLVEKNFNCFLNYVRINKSVSSLLETDLLISEIGRKVGYDNIRSYNRNFKKYYKISPGKFREKFSKHKEQ